MLKKKPMPEQLKINKPLQFRAAFQPKTIDRDKRTVDVVFATENEVLMWDWSIGRYKEILVCEDGAGDLTRLNNGAPLCDTHDTSSVKVVLGVVESGTARFENGEGLATVRFSKRADVEPVWNDVVDGILTGISVSYYPMEYVEVDNVANVIPTLRATKWEATEISLAPVQADRDSKVRSAGEELTERQVKLTRKSNYNHNRMSENEKGSGSGTHQENPERPVGTENNNPTDPKGTEQPGAQATDSESRAKKEGAAEERARVSGIRAACRAAKLPFDFEDKLIDDGTSIDKARELIINEMAKEEKATPGIQSGIRVGKDTEDKRREAISAALSLRSGKVAEKDFKPEIIAAARQYRSMSLVELAKDSLSRGGVDFSMMDKMEIVGRAFTSSTSDFPVLLGGVVHQTLLTSYQATPDTWRKFCAIGSVNDFRPYKRLRRGSFSRLDKVGENAEFKTKKITDAEVNSVQAETFGNVINVSRQMIVNDDLGAFVDLATDLGRAAARSVEIDVYALLAEDPMMDDGATLFDASRKNVVTGSAPSAASFDEMRVKMGEQTDKDLNEILDLRPSILLIGSRFGGDARTINDAQYDPDTANKLQKPNKARGIFNNIVDTARIQSTAYYAIADPSEAPVIEVSFLNGNQTPFIETQEGFNVDGVKWKVRHDYGVGAVGFRGIVKNPGA